MATYLFAWNPKYWNWPELPDELRRLARKGFVDTQWSSGRIRKIEPGSRAFMVRLGAPPKGIMASGVTLTEPVEGLHWRDDKRLKGTTTMHLDIRWDTLFELPLIPLEDLAVPPFSRFRWATRMSGMRIPSHVADALEELWEARVAAVRAAVPKKAGRGSATPKKATARRGTTRHLEDPRTRGGRS